MERPKRQSFKVIPRFASLAAYVLAFGSWCYKGRAWSRHSWCLRDITCVWAAVVGAQTLGLNLAFWILAVVYYIHRNFLDLLSGILKFHLRVYFRITLKIFMPSGEWNSEFIHSFCPSCKSALLQWDFQSLIMFPSLLLCAHLTEADPQLHIYIFHFFK